MLKILWSNFAYLLTHLLISSLLSIINYIFFACIDLYGHLIPDLGPYGSTTFSRATNCCEALIIVFTAWFVWTRTTRQIREIWLQTLTGVMITLAFVAFDLIVLECMKLLEEEGRKVKFEKRRMLSDRHRAQRY